MAASEYATKRQRIESEVSNSIIIKNSSFNEPLHIPTYLADQISRTAIPEPYTVQSALNNESKISHLNTLCVRGLPAWANESDLKDLITRLSTAGLESLFSMTHGGQQIITNVQIARDPATQKCIGYAQVEFVEHAVAAEILATLPGPNFKLPGSNAVLSLQWSQAPINPSSILDNYHIYLGNMKPNLSDRSLCMLLQSFHPGIASVQLVPSEVLGPSPEYIENVTVKEEDDEENQFGKMYVCDAFYCATNHYKEPEEEKLVKIKCPDRSWGCGFVRLEESYVPHWKHVIRVLRENLNGLNGITIRRTPFVSEKANERPDAPHKTTAIVVRPVYGKFDSQSAYGYKYTGSNFPTALSRKKPGHTGGNFPKPSPLLPTSPAPSLTEPEHPLGPRNKTSIFVSNLSDDTVDEDMVLLLSPFGVVLSARVAFMKHAAFVDMGDFRSVLAALSHIRGVQYKNDHQLQLDWGRERTMMGPVLRNMDKDCPHQRIQLQQEKRDAWERLHSMNPVVRPVDVTQPIKAPSTEDKSFWLSCLCAALPQKITKKDDTELSPE